MSALVLESLTWSGGPPEGLSLEASSGKLRSLRVPAARALGGVIMGVSSGSGRVIFKGEDVSRLPAWQRARRGLFLAAASSVALPGLGPAALLRAGLEARRLQSPRQKNLRSFLAGRIAAEDWDQPPDQSTAWTFSLLAVDCFKPEFVVFCPPNEVSAAALAGRPGGGLILLEKP